MCVQVNGGSRRIVFARGWGGYTWQRVGRQDAISGKRSFLQIRYQDSTWETADKADSLSLDQ